MYVHSQSAAAKGSPEGEALWRSQGRGALAGVWGQRPRELLTALLKAPGVYSPRSNTEKCGDGDFKSDILFMRDR